MEIGLRKEMKTLTMQQLRMKLFVVKVDRVSKLRLIRPLAEAGSGLRFFAEGVSTTFLLPFADDFVTPSLLHLQPTSLDSDSDSDSCTDSDSDSDTDSGSALPQLLTLASVLMTSTHR